MARMTPAGDLAHRRASVPDRGNACGGLVMAVLLAAHLLAVAACAGGGEPGYTAQMRNDASTTYLVDYKSDQVVWVFRVPGHSTVESLFRVGRALQLLGRSHDLPDGLHQGGDRTAHQGFGHDLCRCTRPCLSSSLPRRPIQRPGRGWRARFI